MTQTF